MVGDIGLQLCLLFNEPVFEGAGPIFAKKSQWQCQVIGCVESALAISSMNNAVAAWLWQIDVRLNRERERNSTYGIKPWLPFHQMANSLPGVETYTDCPIKTFGSAKVPSLSEELDAICQLCRNGNPLAFSSKAACSAKSQFDKS